MVEIDGVRYLIAVEAARYLGISRCQFYHNCKLLLAKHKIGARRRFYYKQSDLDQFRIVQTISA